MLIEMADVTDNMNERERLRTVSILESLRKADATRSATEVDAELDALSQDAPNWWTS